KAAKPIPTIGEADLQALADQANGRTTQQQANSPVAADLSILSRPQRHTNMTATASDASRGRQARHPVTPLFAWITGLADQDELERLKFEAEGRDKQLEQLLRVSQDLGAEYLQLKEGIEEQDLERVKQLNEMATQVQSVKQWEDQATVYFQYLQATGYNNTRH